MADTPKLTAAEADQMRFWLHPWDDLGLSLIQRGLLIRDNQLLLPNGITDLGRAALAAYDAEQRRAIRVEAMREIVDGTDLAGRTLPQLLLDAAEIARQLGGGPLEDCLGTKAAELCDLIAKEESNG